MDESINLLDGLDVDIPEASLDSPPRPQRASAGEGEFFGPYQLIQEVGVGGVARVLRARHIHPRYAETTFAIKILHDELSRDPKVVTLFRHEAYVLSMLKHPNIVQTFEGGVQDDKLFIAMEYIDGRDLDNMMVRCKRGNIPVPIPLSMWIVGETLKGLSYAHDLCDADGNRLMLVHRDVNPANVFLSYDGRVKLGDFGVASITAGRTEKSRELAGKLGYFAPEQLAGEDVDQRADQFALGVMMFEILTGTRLFDGDDTDKVMRLNKKAKIPRLTKLNPKIPEGLEEVVLKALERRPQDRYPNARAMYFALKPFIPDAAGMPLAVAAMVRKVFVREHIQELQLLEGLAGSSPARGSGQRVAVLTPDERAQAAFMELLTSRGYRVDVQPSLPALTSAVSSGNIPNVVLADVGAPGFDSRAFLKSLEAAPHPISVVAVSEGLEGQSIRAADAIGAVDLLFKPLNIERVLTAVRAAVTGVAKIATVDNSLTSPTAATRIKLLLLSSDPSFISGASRGLAERGYIVEVSPTLDEAIERLRITTYDAFIYDATPPSPSDRFFATQIRGGVGLGLVPILYLVANEVQASVAGMDADRSAVRLRTDSLVLISETLNRLLADTRLGRSFIRYPASFPTELRYGGRAFAGKAEDISRGGVMLRCEQMPPVGELVSVSMRLPNAIGPIEVLARVIRVDLPRHGDELPGIGIIFERFVQRGEADLIAHLGGLERDPKRRQTLILPPVG